MNFTAYNRQKNRSFLDWKKDPYQMAKNIHIFKWIFVCILTFAILGEIASGVFCKSVESKFSSLGEKGNKLGLVYEC